MHNIDWTTIIATAIIAVPAWVAAFYSLRTHREVTTPNGATLGEMASQAIETGAANHAILKKQNGGHDE